MARNKTVVRLALDPKEAFAQLKKAQRKAEGPPVQRHDHQEEDPRVDWFLNRVDYEMRRERG
jgi:hypothetical protein